MANTLNPERAEVSSPEKIIPDNYFTRIAYHGPRSATLRVLTDIHRAHIRNLPFENLNPLLRIPVHLDINSIQKKIVDEGRGGYCFEHNSLFGQVLKILGFDVTGLAARVMWNVAEGFIPPRGHMLLLVKVKGVNYIADTGFGGLTLPEPLALTLDLPQKTTHETFRFVEAGSEYILQAQVKNEWKSLYRFSLLEHLAADYAVVNYYLSTHSDSYFVNNLAAARVVDGKRLALRNKLFTVHDLNGPSTTREVTSVEEMKRLLENVFLIRLPQHDRLDETLQKIIQL